MRFLLSWIATVLLVAAGSSATDPSPFTLTGRVLLPEGTGNRGIEVIVTDRQAKRSWILFDQEGAFSESLAHAPKTVVVSAGGRRVVQRVEIEAPQHFAGSLVDLGVMDLRDKLKQVHFVLKPNTGAAADVVRIGMWRGPPPRDSEGSLVSLGSRQFPPVPLGSRVEWLLPTDVTSIYFLVERPDGPGRGREWRTGQQTIFGPFGTAAFPQELSVD